MSQVLACGIRQYILEEKEKNLQRIEQTKKKGKRLNICGLLEVGKSFEYGLVLKSFKSESYIKLMDWQATQAKERWEKTGKLTVVVQDQGSIHISKLTKSHYEKDYSAKPYPIVI